MRIRRLLLALGLVALVVGIVALVAPGVLPFDANRAFVVLVGLLAALLAARAIQARRHADLDWAATPDVELTTPTPRPGHDVGAILDGFARRQPPSARPYSVREGLGAVAVAVLTRFGSYTEAEAQEAVATGTWTEEDHAAAFLGSARSLDDSLRPVLRNAIRKESAFQRGRRLAIDEIARRAGLSLSTADGTDASSDGSWTSWLPGRDGGNSPSASTEGTATGLDGTGRSETGSSATGSSTSAPSSDGGTTRLDAAAESRETGHWRGVSAVALLGIGAGIFVRQPAVLLAGVVGVGYVAYARSSTPPAIELTIDRSIDADAPDPGDEVDVTLTVTNAGDRTLTDLRVIDGVPAALSVADGSPRAGTALRPGEDETIEYSVRARRGSHDFEPALAITRDLPSTTEREHRVGPGTTLTCVPPLGSLAEPVPLRDRGSGLVGREASHSAGEGIEFHSTREYRAGDPIARIDWNRRARTGELSTVEFREERAATVVLLIDARASAYRSPSSGPPHAVDRAVDAAGQLLGGLLAGGNRVGIAAAPAASCWLAPGSDADHAVEARQLLATHAALHPIPPERSSLPSRWERRLRRRLPEGAQVILLTPLCDDGAVEIARQFDERGHPVTVLGVDPTMDDSQGNRLARVTRTLRIAALRGANVPVVDWDWDEPLAAAIARANERGSP